MLLPWMLFFLTLSGCSSGDKPAGKAVTVSIGDPSASTSTSATNMLAGALISSAYPYLGEVTLQITGAGYNSAIINSNFNDSSFAMNANGDAMVLNDTQFSIRVPIDSDLTFVVTAYNLNGNRLFSATTLLTLADLAQASPQLPMAMRVDIDPAIPVLATDAGCSGDDDGDGFCNDYEDVFVNAAGVPDIDGDGIINSLDTDSDGDGVSDDLDANIPANDGYPTFIHANTPPSSVSLNLTTTVGTPVSGDPVVVDADEGDCHTKTIVSQPANGTATILAGGIIDPTNPYGCVFYTVSYDPAPWFAGNDSFTIQATDRNGAFIEGTVTVTVSGTANQAPVASADSKATVENVGATVDLLANDTDAEGDSFTISVVDSSGVNGGVVTDIGGGRVFYTPPANFTGSDSFNYTIIDGFGRTVSASATVTVRVDSDGDGLANIDETAAGTNSALIDSDGDGFSDGHEVAAGSSPTSNASTPTGTVISAANGNNVIGSDVVWDLAGSPYWVQSGVSIALGASLTIEPGVAVKHMAGAAVADTVTGGGTLRVFGATGANQVVFTSDRDDTVQGDTNGDINSTLPAPNDWIGPRFMESSSGIVRNAIFHFANIGMDISGASPSLDGVSLLDNYSHGLSLLASLTAATSPSINNLNVVGCGTNPAYGNCIDLNGDVTPMFIGINTVSGQSPTTGRASIEVTVEVTATAAPTVSNINVAGGEWGLHVQDPADGTYSNNLFRNANTSGILLETTGNPVISNNTIINNGTPISSGGITIYDAGAGTVIEHNLIKGNRADGGGGIYQASASNPQILNNLIVDNEGRGYAGGGVLIAAGATATLRHNTLSGNVSGLTSGGGLYVDGGATVTLVDNIFAFNYEESDGLLANDVALDPSATVNSSYNLVMDGTALTGPGDVSAQDPAFILNWYLDSAVGAGQSPAIDTGSTLTLPAYLSALGTPTTYIDGTVDTSVGDQVDMGYHHNAAAQIVSEANSTVSYTNISPSPFVGTDTIVVIPVDASGQPMGSGHNVRMTYPSLTWGWLSGTGVCDSLVGYCSLIDNGDGSYTITYDNTLTGCTSACADSFQIMVNGTTFSAAINYTW